MGMNPMDKYDGEERKWLKLEAAVEAAQTQAELDDAADKLASEERPADFDLGAED